MSIVRGLKDASEVERDLIRKLNDLTSFSKLDLYVSSTNGDDDNDGLSPSTPLKTLKAAQDKIPRFLAAPVVVHLASGTYTPVALSDIAQLTNNSRVWFYGDGAGQPGDDGFTVVLAEEAVAAGTTNLLLNATSALTPGALAGSTIEIVSGPGAGERKTIASNDATSITPCAAFSVTPTTSSTFRVVDPGAVLDFNTIERDLWIGNMGKGTAGSMVGPFVVLANLKLDSVTINIPGIYNSALLLHGVKTSMFFGPFYANSVLVSGFTKNFDIGPGSDFYNDIGLPGSTGDQWNGWGLSYSGGAFVWNGFNSNLTGYVHCSGQLVVQQGSVVELYGGRAVSAQVKDGSHFRINSTGEPSFVIEGATSAGSLQVQGASGFDSSGNNLVINNTGSGPCIRVREGATVYWSSQGFRPTGSSTGGPGMLAAGGRIVFVGAPIITGSTPGTNDTELDNGTQAGNAAFSGAGTGIGNLGSVIHRIG